MAGTNPRSSSLAYSISSINGLTAGISGLAAFRLKTFCVHQVEGQCLFVIKYADRASLDNLTRQVQQCRNDLETCLIVAGLLTKYFKKLRWSLPTDL
jgi:hypothetical protein